LSYRIGCGRAQKRNMENFDQFEKVWGESTKVQWAEEGMGKKYLGPGTQVLLTDREGQGNQDRGGNGEEGILIDGGGCVHGCELVGVGERLQKKRGTTQNS